MDSFGAQNLATKGTQIPYCNAMQDDDWNYNQPVDGDEKVFMCLVDYGLADGQLAHATPSKPHEWMVSNLLSPYSSTLAMHAQSDSGGCGKLIVLGFKNQDEQDKTCIAHAGLASIKDTHAISSPGSSTTSIDWTTASPDKIRRIDGSGAALLLPSCSVCSVEL